MQTTWQTTRALLTVDRLHVTGTPQSSTLSPVLTGILNLFFCAYAERFLENDPGGRFLSLFLFLEGSVFALLVFWQFLTVAEVVLKRTRVFPTSSGDRYLFATVSCARRPVCIALWLTTMFALVLLHRTTVGGVLFAPLLYTLLILNIQIIGAALLLSLSRRGHPLTGFAALSALAAFAVLFAFLIFQFESVLTGLPFLSWAVTGMLQAAHGKAASAALSALLLSLGILAGIEAGRRWS